MKRRFCLVPLVVCAVAVAVACGKSSPTPSTPSSAIPGDANANPDGSTLKATAPTPQSPVNGARPDAGVTLVVGNSTLKFANTGQPLSYRFEIYNAAGSRVYQSSLVPAGASTTSHDVQAELNVGEMHSWQARPEYLGTVGPWSARTNATFIAPDSVGFMKGNELYDPLTQGKTKFGHITGPHQWIPGVGLKLLAHESLVTYELPATCSECEMSLIVTGLAWNTKGGKTKLFSMGQGYGDIVTNDRRMTVEKRGDPPGIVAWRFITHGDQVDTEGPEREEVFFDPGQTYLWEASWRNNFFNVRIVVGTNPNGEDIYEKGKHFEGRAYDPVPHVVYLGGMVGRSGIDGASVPDVVYRHVWVSPNPRPGYANK